MKTLDLREKILFQIKDKAIWVVFLVLFIGFSFAHERFLHPNNLLIVLRQVSMLGIASIGMTFVILIAGIDLSVGSIVTIVNIACAYMMVNMGMSMWVAIPISLVMSTLIGLANGFMVSTIGIPALIATFATQTAVEGAAFLWSEGKPIFGWEDETFRVIGQGYVFNFPYIGPIPVPVIIMAVCFAIGSFILNKTYFGRYFYAVGGNEDASKLSGIRVGRVKYLVFALSGFFAGLAGIVLLSRTNSGQPTAGKGFEFDVITCVVLGGVSVAGGIGKFSNVLAGVLIIGILNNGMVLMNISSFAQMIIKGAILALAVGFDTIQNRRQLT
jgi:ribose transport system permease protein